MSSEAITRNDLSAILNAVIHGKPSEYKKLLWANPSPTANFGTQTVISNTDLTIYDEIEIYYSANTGYPDCDHIVRQPIGTNSYIFGSSNWLTAKSVSITTNSIGFGDSTRYTYGGNGTVDNAQLIPQKIYGIKYERVAPPQVEYPNYSTEEQQVGTWIDGKPIYRKVIITSNLSAGLNAITAPSNIDTFVTLRGMEKESGGAQAPIPKAHNSTFAYQIGMYYSGGNIYIEVGSNLTYITSAYIICEYTKTTD